MSNIASVVAAAALATLAGTAFADNSESGGSPFEPGVPAVIYIGPSSDSAASAPQFGTPAMASITPADSSQRLRQRVDVATKANQKMGGR